MSDTEFVKKEQERQHYIQLAVKAAEDVIKNALEAMGSTDPDIEAYMYYKVGAASLMKGVISIDRRVMLSDMGATKLVIVDPVITPQVPDIHFCNCGRRLSAHHADSDVETCDGCFMESEQCKCKKLSPQIIP